MGGLRSLAKFLAHSGGFWTWGKSPGAWCCYASVFKTLLFFRGPDAPSQRCSRSHACRLHQKYLPETSSQRCIVGTVIFKLTMHRHWSCCATVFPGGKLRVSPFELRWQIAKIAIGVILLCSFLIFFTKKNVFENAVELVFFGNRPARIGGPRVSFKPEPWGEQKRIFRTISEPVSFLGIWRHFVQGGGSNFPLPPRCFNHPSIRTIVLSSLHV